MSTNNKRKHLCPTCGSGFMKRWDLTRHERIHTGEKPYACDTCGSRFTQSSSLKIHLRTHTGEKPYKCLHCHESFSHSHRLKSHILKFHINSHHVQCNDCHFNPRCAIVSDKHAAARPSSIPERDKLIDDDHPAERVPENPDEIDDKATKCPQIQLIDDDRGLSKKKNIPHTANGLVCKCNSVENNSNFSCKCYDVPSGVKIFTCHFQEAKPLRGSFMCDACGLFFKDSSSLGNHLKIHRDDKQFKCSSCKLRFIDASDLKKHCSIVHSEEKPFTCKVCRSSFSLAGNLKVHMRTHTGERPFICELCGDRFKHSQALKAHAKVHNQGTNVHTCPVCSVSYSSFKLFKQHLKTHSKFYHTKGKGNVSISNHHPIFVIQEASVNQGLRVANQTSDYKVENKWSPQSQEVTIKTADERITQVDFGDESEEELGHGEGVVKKRSESPATSPGICDDEAFPTFQDHYLSETEHATSVEVECQNNVQDKVQSFIIPNPGVNNSSIPAIQNLSGLKESIPADEEFFEISQTCDYYGSNSGRNKRTYPQSEIRNTNLSEGNTNVITYVSSEKDESLYELSPSGKKDCQLAVKNLNMPAFNPPTCFSIEKKTEENNISIVTAETSEQRSDRNYFNILTAEKTSMQERNYDMTSDYQTDQEIEENVQMIQLARGQVEMTEERTSDKELKCTNCPLQLFDASVISVLCEDGCFGEMLERNSQSQSHSEEQKEINENVAPMPEVKTTQAVSAASNSKQTENIAQELDKMGDKGNNTDVEKVGEEAFLTDTNTMQSENDILRKRTKKHEDRENVNAKGIVNFTFTEVALESEERDNDMGFKRIPHESSLLIEQTQKMASVPNAKNSNKNIIPEKIANRSAIERSGFSVNHHQVKNDDFPITPLGEEEEERHGVSTQESHFDDSLRNKSCRNFNDDEIHATSTKTENVKEDTLQSKISTSTIQQWLPVSSLDPVPPSSEEKTKTFNDKSPKSCARRKRFTTRKLRNKRSLQKRTVTEVNLKNQDRSKYKSNFSQVINLHEHFQKQENGCSTHDQVSAGFSELYNHHCHEQVRTSGCSSCICPICHISFLFHKALVDNHVKMMPLGRLASNSRSVKPQDGTAAVESSSKYLFQQTIDVNSNQSTLLYLCQVCGESLSSLSSLNHHMRSHKNLKNKEPYACKFCSAEFAKFSELAKHKRIHTRERPYKCEVCSRSFSQKTNLQIHMRTHTGERPFMCRVCKDSFAHSQALKLHLRFHAKDTQFICQDCGKGFVVKAALEKHIRSHTGEKPFVCHICDIRLSSQSSLSRHLKRHLGNDLLPVACSLCSIRFAKSGHLRLHMKSHGQKT